jgi:hemerythrin
MLTDDHPLDLGDPRLDQDHRRLLALSETLRQASPEAGAARQALAELREHAQAHFAFEDGELRALGGPDMQCHLDEHAAVLSSLAEVAEVLDDSATTAATVTHLTQSLAAELLRWLPEHVHYMDSAVALARARARLGAAPIRIRRKPQTPAEPARTTD